MSVDAPPLLPGDDNHLLFCGPQAMTRGEFRARVAALAMRLPAAPAAINLCERRDHFMLGFCAALLRGQATLMPPSRAPEAVAEVAARHPGSHVLGDADGEGVLRVDLAGGEADLQAFDWHIPAQRVALIAYTSGSTGAPSANAKSWGSLQMTDAGNRHALGTLFPQAGGILATVPPQHMYGMEMSVLMPLLGSWQVHPGRPFFPEDIVRMLAETTMPRLLVTTPVHLRALLQAGVELPRLQAIVTATAPLPRELAIAAEARFGCELHELFGATEVCVFAHRRSARETHWRLYPDTRLQPLADGTRVHRPSLVQPRELADIVGLVDYGRGFILRGRQSDLLEIAGKRASLADLGRRLLAIPGIRDAAMLQLDADDSGIGRLLALVFADPALEDAAILAALRRGCDPVFLPRRILRVDALPRNETGKLPREALLALVETAEAAQPPRA
ncbi:AMP-binding protein [Luteimonas sp. e5]